MRDILEGPRKREGYEITAGAVRGYNARADHPNFTLLIVIQFHGGVAAQSVCLSTYARSGYLQVPGGRSLCLFICYEPKVVAPLTSSKISLLP